MFLPQFFFSFLFLTFFILSLRLKLVFAIQAVNQITQVHGGSTRRERAFSASNEPEKGCILLPPFPLLHILYPSFLPLLSCLITSLVGFIFHPFDAITMCYFINYENFQYSPSIQYTQCFLKPKKFWHLYFSI